MNEIVHKFLLTGDKFMPELYSKQARFTYGTLSTVYKTLREDSKL